MLPVIEIPLLQQSQCQYHNNFFCHVVYERIQEHGGSKVFHLSETSVCGHFLTFQVSCAKIVYCIAAVRVVALWMIFALYFFLIELLHIGGAWLFWQNITGLDGGFSVLANIDDVSAFYARCGVHYSFYLI